MLRESGGYGIRRASRCAASRLSASQHLPEPQQRGLAILPRHVIDRSAVAEAVAQLSELCEADVEHLFAPEPLLEMRPEDLRREHVLKLAEVAILELAGEGLIVPVPHAGIPPAGGGDPLGDFGAHVGRERVRLAVQGVGDEPTDLELDSLDLHVE